MQKLKKTLSSLLVAAVAMGFWAGSSSAENLDIDELSAFMVFPIITGGYPGNELKDTTGDVIIPQQKASTLVTLTNGASDNRLLKIDMISGDPGTGATWQTTSIECELTGRETTTFLFVGAGTGSGKVFVECSDGPDTEGAPVAKFTGLQNGILTVAVMDPFLPATGLRTLGEDVLFGDAIVVDTQAGQAYSFGGIGFQAGQGANTGDKIFAFDGSEYTTFPSVLATNFIAPTDYVNAELILFTLDGTVGNLPVPRAKLGGFAYNDDEVSFDFTYEFDCFDIVSLLDINDNFEYTGGALGLGSVSGHVELVPQPITTPGPDAHDAEFGNADNTRKRGVHGWFVQNVEGTLIPPNEPIKNADSPGVFVSNGPAAWGRPLAQSTTSLVAFPGDEATTLNADVLK